MEGEEAPGTPPRGAAQMCLVAVACGRLIRRSMTNKLMFTSRAVAVYLFLRDK